MTVNPANVAATGTREMGLEMPIEGKTKLIKTPENITKARLKPTES